MLSITASSSMFRFHYLELFLSNEVDMSMFTTLNSQDLISIGIASFGARKIMLNAIEGTLFNVPCEVLRFYLTISYILLPLELRR